MGKHSKMFAEWYFIRFLLSQKIFNWKTFQRFTKCPIMDAIKWQCYNVTETVLGIFYTFYGFSDSFFFCVPFLASLQMRVPTKGAANERKRYFFRTQNRINTPTPIVCLINCLKYNGTCNVFNKTSLGYFSIIKLHRTWHFHFR